MEWADRSAQRSTEISRSIHIVKGIFELGLKNPQVQSSPEYVHEYAKWLVSAAGEVGNARIVLRNAVANEVMVKTPEIWKYYLEFEAEFGTVQEILNVESQRRQALGEKADRPVDILKTQCNRYTTMGLWPCTNEQKQYIAGLSGVGDETARFAQVSAMPAQLTMFIQKLPEKLEPDQPVPDIDFVLSILMDSTHPELGNMNGVRRGVKRNAPGMQDGTPQPAYADIFTHRQKQKQAS